MKDTVLILTNSTDRSVTPVANELELLGEKFYRFDTETFPSQKTLTAELSGKSILGSLNEGGGQEGISLVALGDVKSVWYRRPIAPHLPDNQDSGYAKFIKFEDRSGYFEVATVYAEPGGATKEYLFKVNFALAKEEQGELQSGWARIIILDGEKRTLAEYPETERIDVWNKNYLAIARDLT